VLLKCFIGFWLQNNVISVDDKWLLENTQKHFSIIKLFFYRVLLCLILNNSTIRQQQSQHHIKFILNSIGNDTTRRLKNNIINDMDAQVLIIIDLDHWMTTEKIVLEASWNEKIKKEIISIVGPSNGMNDMKKSFHCIDFFIFKTHLSSNRTPLEQEYMSYNYIQLPIFLQLADCSDHFMHQNITTDYYTGIWK
jgi:hypothetical protein